MTKLAIICWKWKPAKRYRSVFGPETVNVFRSMVERNYPHPHEVVCVTDDPAGIDPRVRIVPLWDEFANIPNPHGTDNPSCYRRLKAFSAEAAGFFGPRFVSVDLDCVITGDMSSVWNRPEDFIIWGNTNPHTQYNGSMFMMNAGARKQVYETFDPLNSPKMSKASGNFGSDQGWISLCLGVGEARWNETDGVYSFRNQIAPKGGSLPRGAKIVFFHGQYDPWQPIIRGQFRWVRENYR